MNQMLTKNMKRNRFAILRVETNNGPILQIINLWVKWRPPAMEVSRQKYQVRSNKTGKILETFDHEENAKLFQSAWYSPHDDMVCVYTLYVVRRI